MVESLVQIKSNMDNGVFTAMQRAGAAALEGYDRPGDPRDSGRCTGGGAIAWSRRSQEAGLEVNRPEATFYVWVKCPGGLDSRTFADRVLAEADLVVTPGIGYGPHGEGYFRMSLTVPEARLREAAARIKRLKF